MLAVLSFMGFLMGMKHPYTAEKHSELCYFVNKLKFRPIVVTYGLRKKKDMDKASSNCPLITFISELEHFNEKM